MSESTFPIELIGGSRDGEILEVTAAPDYLEGLVGGGLKEIYEPQNDEAPFVYVKIGYAEKETWRIIADHRERRKPRRSNLTASAF